MIQAIQCGQLSFHPAISKTMWCAKSTTMILLPIISKSEKKETEIIISMECTSLTVVTHTEELNLASAAIVEQPATCSQVKEVEIKIVLSWP